MSRKKFTGVRRRIEGERARHAARVVVERGYTIKQEGRLGDDTGYIIRTREGPVINLYDTGSILISGNNRHLFGEVDSLRLPDSSPGVLIVANEVGEALADLSAMLSELGIVHDDAVLAGDGWMMDVAEARKRGLHVVVLVTASEWGAVQGSIRVAPRVYFALGLLLARLGRTHVTVVCQDAVQMPSAHEMLGAQVVRYGGRVGEILDQLRFCLGMAGVRFGESMSQS